MDESINLNSECFFATNAVNVDNKTVDVVLSEETKVIRFDWENGIYDLVLQHNNESIDFSRKDIMPVLLQHEQDMLPIGKWKNIRLVGGKIKGTAIFDKQDEKAMEVFGKIERGFMQSFSVGISIEKKILEEEYNENGRKTFKATRWGMNEASVVTVPAIPNAKVGFNKENNTKQHETCYNNDDKVNIVDNKQKNKEKVIMDIIKFKAEHPNVFAEVYKSGVDSEKDRVNAHIEMAKATGATEYALECIAKGDGLTQTAQAKYMTFGLNKRDITAKTDDNIPPITTPEESKNVKEREKEEALAVALKVDLKTVEGK